MNNNHSELTSVSSQLTDITQRVSDIAAEAHEDDDDLIELLEVERQLQTANRRLAKLVS